MSAFLGPIHSLMYHRIITMQTVINSIGELAKKEGWDESVDDYLITEFAPIEEVVDLNNIHGSLFGMVDGAEKRFSGIICTVIKKDDSRIAAIEKEMEVVGKSMHIPAGLSVEEAAFCLQEILLDGMPCDRSSEVITVSDTECKIVRTADLHSDYFVNEGMNGDLYYRFLEAFVKGLLMEYQYHTTDHFQTELTITEVL